MRQADQRGHKSWEASVQVGTAQPDEAVLAVRPGPRDAGLAQNPEVVRHTRPAQPEIKHGASVLVTIAQYRHDGEAHRIAERM